MKRMTFGGSDSQQEEPPGFARTDYRCAAQGCPNMGGIGGRLGVNRSGTCFYHYQSDALAWSEVTRRILSDDRMRDGFVSGRDTVQQAQMRRAMKSGLAANVLLGDKAA